MRDDNDYCESLLALLHYRETLLTRYVRLHQEHAGRLLWRKSMTLAQLLSPTGTRSRRNWT